MSAGTGVQLAGFSAAEPDSGEPRQILVDVREVPLLGGNWTPREVARNVEEMLANPEISQIVISRPA